MSGYAIIGLIGISYSIYFLKRSTESSVKKGLFFSILLSFSCSLFALGSLVMIRDKPIEKDISINLPYSPPSMTVLDDLPLNRYPFLGAHDAGTFLQENTNRPWLITLIGYLNKWAYTQSLNFVQQYTNGVRYFDFRFQFFNKDTSIIFRHGDGDVAGMDIGIVFYPPKHIKYISLDTMLEKCIADKECIYINIKKEAGDKPLYDGESMTGTIDPKRSIYSNFAYFLSNTHSGKNYLPNVYWIESVNDLRKPISWYKQQQKYIIISRSEFVNENWDVGVVCQSNPISSMFKADSCMNDSCANPNSLVWTKGQEETLLSKKTTGFFEYINRIYGDYTLLRPSNMNVTQALFQSYASLPNLAKGVPISSQDCTKGDILRLESIAHVSYRMYEFMTKHPGYVTNVLLMDNIGAELSPFTVNGEAQSWSKMCLYQLVNNIVAKRAIADPLYTL